MSKKRGKRKRMLKPVFQTRKRDAEVPGGFDMNLGAVTQDEAYATIEARLNDTRDSLPLGYRGRVVIHAYSDGSVDGELYVRVPADVDQVDAAMTLSHALGRASIGRHYWISAGARYSVNPEMTEAQLARYKAYRGLRYAETNYQRATPTNIAEESLILRKKLLPGMKDVFEEEAHSVFVRVHWNPQGQQPKR